MKLIVAIGQSHNRISLQSRFLLLVITIPVFAVAAGPLFRSRKLEIIFKY